MCKAPPHELSSRPSDDEEKAFEHFILDLHSLKFNFIIERKQSDYRIREYQEDWQLETFQSFISGQKESTRLHSTSEISNFSQYRETNWFRWTKKRANTHSIDKEFHLHNSQQKLLLLETRERKLDDIKNLLSIQLESRQPTRFLL